MQLFVFAVAVAMCASAVVEGEETFSMLRVPALDTPLKLTKDEEKSLIPKLDKKAKNVPKIKGAGKVGETTTINSQIVGGSQASRGQWPWQVYILGDGFYACGGSLVGFKWVLTSAACAKGASSYSLTFGAVRRDVFEEGRVIVDTTVKFIHPSYNSMNRNNDIALIMMASSYFLATSAFIRPVNLPLASQTSTSFEGISATVAGWGLTVGTNPASTSQVLNYVAMPVMAISKCAAVYGLQFVTPATICTDTSAIKSFCDGEGGSPLVYFDSTDRTWTQIGVASFIPSRCDRGYPAAYTKVTAYLSWISSTMSANPAM